jgi:hypothetical protein
MAETGLEKITIARKALDDATSALGVRVQGWVDKAKQAPEGLSAEDTTKLVADLGEVATALNAMGKDPANPLGGPGAGPESRSAQGARR